MRLKAQTYKDFTTYFFQDGAVNEFSGKEKTTNAVLDRCVLCFNGLVNTRICRSRHNIGTGLNYKRAEDHMFGELGVEYAIFLEDDVVLSEHTVDVLRHMVYLFDDDRVGALAVHGYHHDGVNRVHAYPGLAEQYSNKRSLGVPDGNLCYIMSRSSWLAYKGYYDEYLKFIQDVDYQDRPGNAIFTWHIRNGFAKGATSQDWNRRLSMARAGKVFLGTYLVYTKHIGEHGMHVRPDSYASKGFGNAVLFDRPWYEYDMPDDVKVANMLSEFFAESS